jgi:aldehyde:ferredoxin oxidoreductase
VNRIIRVDMENLKITEEKVPDLYEGLGGRALTSEVVAREVPPRCNPLGKQNKLVIAPGLLSGTAAANSGRLSVGSKSPLTGGIKECNAGGTASTKLGRMGIAAIIIERKPVTPRLYCLEVTGKGARLLDGEEYRGLGNYSLVESIRNRYARKVAILSVGKAGEMKMANSTIAVTSTNGTPSRHAGRGGLGAVMASKGLKAVVVDGTGAAEHSLRDPVAFREASRRFVNVLRTYPGTSIYLPKYGTNRMADLVNEAGGYPARNFSSGRFEGIGKVNGDALYETVLQRGGKTTHAGCSTCIIQCSNEYVDKEGKYVTSSLEYETIWSTGANCGIDDLDAIAEMDRLCDDYGFDTIEMGCSIALAMDAGRIRFGDGRGAIALIQEAGEGTPLGRILGNGVAFTARAFGIERVPVVKNQCLSGYDPRAIQGIGVTYATTPMGADHTAGYAIISNLLNIGGAVDPLKPEGQVDLSRKLQIRTAAIDATGLCYFILSATFDRPECFQSIIDMLNARYGWHWTQEDFLALGKRILKTERSFNERAGFTSEDDRLPEFLREERLPPHNLPFLVSDEDLDQMFNF